MDEVTYNTIVDHMDSIVVFAKCAGVTWEDMEQILQDSMKTYGISTGEETKQWTNC